MRSLKSRSVRLIARGTLPLGAAALALLLTAQTALACYGSNEGASGYENGALDRGIKGEVDLVSAQPINQSSAIVHPMQIVYSEMSFVGWGTAKGVGIDQCPDYFGTKWQVYFDGSNLGDYFCKQPYGGGCRCCTGSILPH